MKVLDAFRRGAGGYLDRAYGWVHDKAYGAYEKSMTTLLRYGLSMLPLYAALKISCQMIKETAYERMRAAYRLMKRTNN